MQYVSVYLQVETIGDAYMVVGGLPIPIRTHAERVANMALGMMVASSEVISPVSREPLGVCTFHIFLKLICHTFWHIKQLIHTFTI